jgi:hypothetical protein
MKTPLFQFTLTPLVAAFLRRNPPARDEEVLSNSTGTASRARRMAGAVSRDFQAV